MKCNFNSQVVHTFPGLSSPNFLFQYSHSWIPVNLNVNSKSGFSKASLSLLRWSEFLPCMCILSLSVSLTAVCRNSFPSQEPRTLLVLSLHFSLGTPWTFSRDSSSPMTNHQWQIKINKKMFYIPECMLKLWLTTPSSPPPGTIHCLLVIYRTF